MLKLINFNHEKTILVIQKQTLYCDKRCLSLKLPFIKTIIVILWLPVKNYFFLHYLTPTYALNIFKGWKILKL